MNRVTIAGKISKTEVIQGQSGPFISLTILTAGKTREGNYQLISINGSASGDYMIDLYNKGLLQVESFVVAEGYVKSPRVWQTKEGDSRASLDYAFTSIDNLNVIDMLLQNQAAQAQAQAAAPAPAPAAPAPAAAMMPMQPAAPATMPQQTSAAAMMPMQPAAPTQAALPNPGAVFTTQQNAAAANIPGQVSNGKNFL